MKIDLEVKPKRYRMWERRSGGGSYPVTKCLPFYKSSKGVYFHRVRSAHIHYWNDGMNDPHLSVNFWCGNFGSVSCEGSRGKLYAQLPERHLLCATCEGRAIGSGQDGARIINGRKVIYQPKEGFIELVHDYEDVPIPEVGLKFDISVSRKKG